MTRSSRITLNGKEFNLFKDYSLGQQADLVALSFDDKLKYLEERARLIFLDALDEWLTLVDAKSLSCFHELNILTLVCCVIEGLGHYLTGNDNAGEAFKRFITEFMPMFSPIQDELWIDYRNGLAHGFYVKHGGIEKGLGTPFEKGTGKWLQVDFDLFVGAFRTSFGEFFEKLRADGTKREPRFTARFNEVFGQ